MILGGTVLHGRRRSVNRNGGEPCAIASRGGRGSKPRNRGCPMNLPISSGAALAIAILLEVTGTTALQMSEQLTKLVPTLVMVVCYMGSL